MAEQTDFDDSIRDEERKALHSEMVARLHQKGVSIEGNARDDSLADLLSAIDEFEAAVVKAGGDLYVDSLDSSEPERPEWVLPRMRERESVEDYIGRVEKAAERAGETSP